eukprot:6205339-Pleurochrysis_carterae.AAC.1
MQVRNKTEQRGNENGMRNLTNVSENDNVVNCEDAAVFRSFRPSSPPGVLVSKYQVPKLLWQTG